MTTLHQKTSHAVIWSAVDVFSRQGMQFIVLVMLSRLLTPQDFGTIAMLAIFVGVAGIFIDSGFSSALIQRQNANHIDESTIFFFNLITGVIVSSLLCAMAPWIANYFQQPILRNITYWMALNLFLSTLCSIHTTLLTKELNFKMIAKVSGLASFLSGALAIILANQGFGVWCLVVQILVSSLVSLVLLWSWHPWRPVWSFSFASLRSFFRFGGYEMAANLTDVFSTNLYLIMIGKIFSVREVGFYDRAQRTQQMPIGITMGIINRVAYSAFSSMAKDKDKLSVGLRKAQAISMFVNLPALVALIILAEPLVRTFFGTQWLPCVPILQVLGLGGLLWPLHVLNLNILRAQGRADLFFRITMLKKIFTISLTIVASFYGVMAIAWAQVILSIFAYLVNTYYTKVLLAYGGWKQLNDLAMNFVTVIPMAVAIYLINHMMYALPLIKLIVASVIGCGIYLFTCRLLCKELLNDFLNLAGIQGHFAQR